MAPGVQAFFDETTFTVTYVVWEEQGKHCAIIDPVLDYGANSGRTRRDSADEVISFVREQGLQVDWILETHIHADHLSAAAYLKSELGGEVAIGDQVGVVQKTFGTLFNAEPEFSTEGQQFDRLVAESETLPLGEAEILVLHSPGHTPACVSYLVGDAVFVGDTLFMPDFGTARCDFPGGSAETLYRSVQRLLNLPADTRMFVGHDYGPGGRPYQWETTVAEQRANNKHVRDGVPLEDFVAMRTARDSELDLPALILPAVQVNMRAGQLPPPENNGDHYLKIPIDKV